MSEEKRSFVVVVTYELRKNFNMVYKTKKQFTLEKRLEVFQKKFIMPNGNGGYFNPINIHDFHKIMVPWFYQITSDFDMVPVFTTITFRNLPKGYKGYQLANDNVSKLYRLGLLPYAVDRRRHHLFKDQYPKIIGLPEFGRGELDDWHLHNMMFLKREARIKLLSQHGRTYLNSLFRGFDTNHNVEFHMAPTTDYDDFSEITAYMLKKIAGVNGTLKEEGMLFVWA